MIGSGFARRPLHPVIAGVLCAVAVCPAPAAAIPGLVTGEAMGNVYVEVAANDALSVNFALPDFHLSYTSSGMVHEDGYSTSYVFPESEILIGMDVYAYAFSEPFLPGFKTSETRARGWFDDGVFGTVSNLSDAPQLLDFMSYVSMSVDLYPSQPNDRVSGGYSYQLRGQTGDGPLVDLTPGRTLIELAPSGSYSFRLDDFQMHFFLHASSVPEPGTWLLMLGGLGAAGVTMRRRRAGEVLANA